MKKYTTYFFVCFLEVFFIISYNPLYAVNKLDSLKTELNKSNHDTLKVKNLVKIAIEYRNLKADSSMVYAQQAYQLADQNQDIKGIAKSAFVIADLYLDKEKLTESLKYFLISKNAYEKTGYKRGINDVYGRLGILYYYQYDLLTSYDFYNKTLELSYQLKDSISISVNLSNLAIVYYDLKNFQKALECSEKALEIDKAVGDIDYIVKDKIDIGEIYLKLNDYPQALKWFNDALTHKNKIINKEYFIEIDMNLGESYLGLHKYDSAAVHLKKAHEEVLKIDDTRFIIFSYLTYGKYFEQTKQYDQAIHHFEKGIALNNFIDMINEKVDLYKHLSKAYLGRKLYQKAYDALEKSTILSDSVNTSEINKTILQLDKQKELEKVKSEFLLDQQKRQHQLENAAYRSRILLIFAIVTILLMTATILAVLNSNRIKKKANVSLIKQNEIIEQQKLMLENNIKILREREVELKELNTTKDKFFSIIAHDLKNPFNSLVGFSSLLLDEPDLRHSDQKLEEILQIINKTASLSYDLLENLLHWARSQMGMLKVIPEEFDIKLILGKNIQFFNDQAFNKQITIEMFLNEPLFVYGDINMCSTLVRNLISNALKFTNKGGHIYISGSIKDGFALINVSDTGIGIKQDDIDKLFSIDRSLNRTGTDNEMGTGLGLILCDEFIRKNNGKLFVESEYGKGSTFSFTLPLPV